MSAFARWCHRRRLVVVLLWVALFAGLSVGVASLGSSFSSTTTASHTESSRATALLRLKSPGEAGESGTIVWHTGSGKVTDAAVKQRMTTALTGIAHSSGVAGVVSPYTAQGAAEVSKDGTTAYATVRFTGTKPADSVTGHVKSIAAGARADGLDVQFGGAAFAVTPAASPIGDVLGIGIAAVILLLMFRSAWAAALPIVTAVAGVGTGLISVMLLSHVTSIADTAISLGSLIGLGVGIDYALFIVNRHRKNLMAGMGVGESVAKSLNTSGRAVLFAGLTVIIALLGMFTLGMPLLNGMALGAAVTVALTVLAAVTLLPALLGFLGLRVLSRKQRRRLAEQGAEHAAPRVGFWGIWAGKVRARPKSMALVSIVVLAAVAAPTLSMRLGSADDGNLPTSSTNRQAYDLLAHGFGPGFNGPLVLAAEVSGTQDQQALTALVGELRTTPGVASVTAVPMTAGETVGVLTVVPTTSPQSQQTVDLIDHLRKDVIPPAEQGTGLHVYVGGVTASNADFASVLLGKIPVFLAIIVALGFVLLTVAFRSLLVPALGAVMNVLTIGVAFGVVTTVFQYGFGVSLLGAGAAGPIEAFVPILVVGIMFGLSMDYQVFLVSRMREEWAHSGDNHRAVRIGQQETGQVIAVAACIMFSVFTPFALGGSRVIAEFGLGLAVAVLFDAFVARMVLVPALMHLFGNANWWLPRWLDRALPNLSVEGPVDEDPDRAALVAVPGQETAGVRS
ncbi:MMPL family transporter [Streptacidiphilus carbonis]|uniref:MMPL family transporter n=1 Tax=Streptacidiphilus carbonis TaxID=105422 RepID=UPI0005A6EFE4|nr:MMPL family transporter [Streptacidiphilus carbonis]